MNVLKRIPLGTNHYVIVPDQGIPDQSASRKNRYTVYLISPSPQFRSPEIVGRELTLHQSKALVKSIQKEENQTW